MPATTHFDLLKYFNHSPWMFIFFLLYLALFLYMMARDAVRVHHHRQKERRAKIQERLGVVTSDRPCSYTRVKDMYDAMDRAETTGLIVYSCALCGEWHFRSAKDEQEQDQAGAYYRRMIARKYPEIAEQRGWKKEVAETR